MSVTKELAAYLVASRPDQIPSDVQHEARRALLNYVGCAVGGSREDAVEIALKVVGAFSGERTARVLGRRERLDPLHAALLNGISSHVLDYDDTTPSNYIHPTSPAASALFAYACTAPVTGTDLLHALVLASRSSAASGTRPTRRTTKPAGTAPGRSAYSAPRLRSASCLARRGNACSGW